MPGPRRVRWPTRGAKGGRSPHFTLSGRRTPRATQKSFTGRPPARSNQKNRPVDGSNSFPAAAPVRVGDGTGIKDVARQLPARTRACTPQKLILLRKAVDFLQPLRLVHIAFLDFSANRVPTTFMHLQSHVGRIENLASMGRSPHLHSRTPRATQKSFTGRPPARSNQKNRVDGSNSFPAAGFGSVMKTGTRISPLPGACAAEIDLLRKR